MKIRLFLASAILATAFVSCEKDTDTDPGNGNGNGGGTTQDTIAPVVSNFTVNSMNSRVFAPVGSSINVEFDVSDNEELQFAGFGISSSVEGFGNPALEWTESDIVSISETSYNYSKSFGIPTATLGSMHWAMASAVDQEELEATKLIQVIVTRAGQTAISLPDNVTNAPYTVSLQDSPPRFDLKARFDDGESLSYRRLQIEPKTVEAGKTAYSYELKEDVTGISSTRTYVNIIPDTVATGLYEFTLSAGDSDGNVSYFFGELNITQ